MIRKGLKPDITLKKWHSLNLAILLLGIHSKYIIIEMAKFLVVNLTEP